MKKLLSILVLSLLFSGSAYSEEIFISCKEIDKEKIDRYSFDDQYVYSGKAKYKVINSDHIVVAHWLESPKTEWGYIIINRLSGSLDRAHGVITEDLDYQTALKYKRNKLFEINYNCKNQRQF